MASYILPFVVLPYLTRTLGVENFGKVTFGLSFIALASVFTDFGFDLYGPHYISKNLNDKQKIRKFIGIVLNIKILLIVILIIFIIPGVFFIPKLHPFKEISLPVLLSIVGVTFLPFWFFQGIEKMKFITYIFLITRIIYVTLVFLLVKDIGDYAMVLKIYGISLLLGVVLGGYLVHSFGYWPCRSSWPEVKEVTTNSWGFFLSRVAVSTYTSAGTVVLGLASNMTMVANYSAAEQMYKGAQRIFSSVSQALIPYMTRTKNRIVFMRILGGCLIISTAGLGVGYFFGAEMMNFVFGVGFELGHPILMIFLLILLVNVPSSLLGYPFLGAMGSGKYVNNTVIIAGFFQLAVYCGLYLADIITPMLLVGSIFLSELLVLILRLIKCFKI